jgi:hypothetical protein
MPLPTSALSLERIAELKQLLLRAFGQTKAVSPSHLLLRWAKQPIDSLRNAAMHLMRAVAQQPSNWGLNALFNTTGSLTDPSLSHSEFWLYIKDRCTEFSKEGKQYKFGLIEALHRHAAVAGMTEEIQQGLHAMVREGPFYMPPMVKDLETV